MAQHLKRTAPEHIRNKRKVERLDYFSMTPAELDNHLRNPQQLREAVKAMIEVSRVLLKVGQ